MALLGTAHTCSCGWRRRGTSVPTSGQSQAALPAHGSTGSLCSRELVALCPMAPALPRRTPTWRTSWLLPTSLPKYTKCHHVATGQLPRPSSAVWSCHPSHPRRGSRSPLQRSRRRRRSLRVRLLMSLGPPSHVPGSPGPARWQWGCGAGPAPAPRRTWTQSGGSMLSGAVLPTVQGYHPCAPRL